MIFASRKASISLAVALALTSEVASADISRTTAFEMYSAFADGYWGYQKGQNVSTVELGKGVDAEGLRDRSYRYLSRDDADKLNQQYNEGRTVDYVDFGCYSEGFLSYASGVPENIRDMETTVGAIVFFDSVYRRNDVRSDQAYLRWFNDSLRISEDLKRRGKHQGLEAWEAVYKIATLFELASADMAGRGVINQPIIAEINTECGGGGSFSKAVFVAMPSNARILLISEFMFKLCQIQSKNPWDISVCDGWEDVGVHADYVPLRGIYQYYASWPDGGTRKGTLDIPLGDGEDGKLTRISIER